MTNRLIALVVLAASSGCSTVPRLAARVVVVQDPLDGRRIYESWLSLSSNGCSSGVTDLIANSGECVCPNGSMACLPDGGSPFPCCAGHLLQFSHNVPGGACGDGDGSTTSGVATAPGYLDQAFSVVLSLAEPTPTTVIVLQRGSGFTPPPACDTPGLMVVQDMWCSPSDGGARD